jgi:hypothetical protein
MDYASVSDLKASLRITDDEDNALLKVALDAAKELIDEHCNRTFDVVDEPQTRSFTPAHGIVEIDDIYSALDLVFEVDGVTIPASVPNTSSGYRLLPRNAMQKGEPYTSISYEVFPFGRPFLLAGVRGEVAITTQFWGFAAAVPESVRQANILQASRIFARRLAPFGVAGSPEIGSEIRLLSKVDPDVAVLLSGKVRYR